MRQSIGVIGKQLIVEVNLDLEAVGDAPDAHSASTIADGIHSHRRILDDKTHAVRSVIQVPISEVGLEGADIQGHVKEETSGLTASASGR